MEDHVIACAASEHLPGYLQRGQVRFDDGFCVVILHGSTKDTEYLLSYREDNLMDFVFESLQSEYKSVEAALDSAFDRMDRKLEEHITAHVHGLFWRSRDNSCVVLVTEGIVYCMGYACNRVVLCRRGRDYNIHVMSGTFKYEQQRMDNFSEERHFVFFRKECLTLEDEFLIVATEHNWDYAHEPCGGLSSAFSTRVDAFGLEEAARQMIGYELDDPKVFIAVPLVRSPKVWEINPAELPKIPDYTDVYTCPLLPLIDQQPQCPEPITSALGFRIAGFHPSVTAGAQRSLARICARSSSGIMFLRGKSPGSEIVMRYGDLLQWHPPKCSAAVVIWRTESVQFSSERKQRASSTIRTEEEPRWPRIIYADGPGHGVSLRECYLNCLSEAVEGGVEYLAFPPIFCSYGSGEDDEEQARSATVALDMVVSRAGEFKEVHFVFSDRKMFDIWATVFVGTSFDPPVIKSRNAIRDQSESARSERETA